MTGKVSAYGLSAVVGAVVVAWLARGSAGAQERPAPAAQKWEYKIVYPDNDPLANHAGFNKLGADGWELCVMHSGTRPAYCVFKRPAR